MLDLVAGGAMVWRCDPCPPPAQSNRSSSRFVLTPATELHRDQLKHSPRFTGALSVVWNHFPRIQLARRSPPNPSRAALC